MQQRHKVLTAALAKIHPGRMLDVATGSGSFASDIMVCSRSAIEIIAIDTLLRPLKSITPDRIPGVLAAAVNGMKLAFGDSVFSGVAISHSLHHMDKPEDVLKEMIRVLKPGGIFIVNEMFSDGDQRPSQITHTLMHNWWGAMDRANGVPHNPVYSRNELESLVKSTGITDIEYAVHEDLSEDPYSSELKEKLVRAQKASMERIAGNSKLTAQGKAAWKHYEKHGFTCARTLMAYGAKPGECVTAGIFSGTL